MSEPIAHEDNVNDLANKSHGDSSPVGTTEPKIFFDVLQSAITNRIVKPYDKNIPVTYELTEDPGILHQYYLLRKAMYDKTFKTNDYNWGEDHYDRLSYIIVARRGNLCLGGCRLIVREPDEQWALPMESDNFKLRELFPDLNLDKLRHAEVSRFAVMEDSGEEGIIHGLYKELYKLITSSNIHYVFVKSPYPMARNWRMVANSFGVKTTRIIDNVHPTDNTLSSDIKWYLTLSDLSSFCHDSEPAPVTKVFLDKMSEELN